MAELRCLSRLAMSKRMRPLRIDVLIQAATEGDVERLHTSADAQQRKICSPGQLCHFQLEGRTPLAHDPKLVPLSLAIQLWGEIRTAAGQQEAVDVGEQTASGAKICDQRKDDRDTAEI